MTELSDPIHEEIKRLCDVGDEHAGGQAYPEALSHYWAAWDLLPEPKTEWEAATWVLVAIGDVNYLCGDFVAGCDNLSNAMRCPGAIGNPLFTSVSGSASSRLGVTSVPQTS